MNAQGMGLDLADGFRHPRTGRPDRLAAALRRTLRRLRRWRQRHADRRLFQAMDDRQLADIGLDRVQVASTLAELLEAGGPKRRL